MAIELRHLHDERADHGIEPRIDLEEVGPARDEVLEIALICEIERARDACQQQPK